MRASSGWSGALDERRGCGCADPGESRAQRLVLARGPGLRLATRLDSVTGGPLAVDLVLALANGPGSGETPAKTDFSGKGTACFGPTKFGNTVAGIDTVTLCTCNPVVVHASPDYQTTGTSNSVVVSFAGYTPPTAAPTSPNVIATDGWTYTWAPGSSSPLVGQPDAIHLNLAYAGGLDALTPTLEIDLSGGAGSIQSANADGGSCSGTTTVNCTLPQLSKGGQTGVDLTLLPGAPGQVSVAFVLRFHTMAANGVVFPPSDALAQFNLTAVAPAADLSVALKAAKARVGKLGSATVVIRNAGPQSASGSTVVVTVPAAAGLKRIGGAGATCHLATRTCAIASLGSTQIVLTLEPTRAGTAKISAKVTAGGAADPIASNNKGSLALTILPKLPAKR